MKSKLSLGKDIFFPLVLILFFLFSPFGVIRYLVLFFGLIRLLPFIQSKILAASIVVSRTENVIRAKKRQPFTVEIKIRNRGIFPVHFCTAQDSFTGPFATDSRSFLVSLRARETKTLSYTANGHERGYYTFGPVTLSGTDASGFFTWEKRIEAPLQVIVYPSIFDLSFSPRFGLPGGNIKLENRLYEDVTHYRSIREYMAGDDLKRINWKVSARMGSLYSMEYQPSIYFPVLIVLNLTENDYPTRFKQHLAERAIETAASLVFFYVGLKQDVGFITTGQVGDSEELPVAPIKAGYGHAVGILETLARVGLSGQDSDFTRVIFKSGLSIQNGTKVMVVTPPLHGNQITSLLGVRKKGYELEVFLTATYLSKKEEIAVPGIKSHVVKETGSELVDG
jgi:uncharacterized protein (DUF58 family)